MARTTSLTVQFDAEQFNRAMREVPGKLFDELRDGFKTHHRRFLNHFKRTRLRKTREGEGVQTRSGALRRSFHVESGGSRLEDLFATTFSAGVPYASIQEEGGEITPKRGKYLAIPLDAAKTRAGVTRKPPRQWTDTFFIRSKKGTLLLMQKRAHEMIPLFAMVKRVVIPGELGFMKTWDEQLPKLVTIVTKATKSALAPEVAR